MAKDVDQENPVFFIHIPKTAGSTFRELVKANYCPFERRFIYPVPNAHNIAMIKSNIEEIQFVMGHFKYGFHKQIDNVSNFKYCAFLRNPSEQVISHYYYLLRSDLPYHKDLLKDIPDFNSFLDHEWSYNLQTQFITGLTASELKGMKKEEVVNIIKDLKNIDIYISELFDYAVLLISEKLIWNYKFYTSKNVNKKRKNREEISHEDLSKLSKNVQYDEILYGICYQRMEKNISELLSEKDLIAHRKKLNRIESIRIYRRVIALIIKTEHLYKAINRWLIKRLKIR